MAAIYEATQIGKRQEISEKIFNVESEKTPFLSLLKKGPTPNQMLMSWQAEVYPAAPSTGIKDGAPATGRNSVPRILVEGCAQHFRREWSVTTLANLTNVAGVGRNEVGRQRAKAMVILKKMIEQQLLSADDCAVESGETPWTTRGALAWISNGAQGVKPVDAALRNAAGAIYTGAVASLTEGAFRDLLEAAYGETNEPLSLDGFCGIDLKAILDDFTQVYPTGTGTSQAKAVYNMTDVETYKNKVEWLRFSAGDVRLHLNPFMAYTTSTGAASAYSPKSGVFLNMDMWEMGWLMQPANTNLAPDGSGANGYIDAVAGIKCLNPRGQMKVYSNS
jgi:hypothetical protein